MQPRARIELGPQLYAVLEQCRKPDVLWAELATGHYDWLGVRRNGKWRVRLVLDGRAAAERYVVRSLPRLT